MSTAPAPVVDLSNPEQFQEFLKGAASVFDSAGISPERGRQLLDTQLAKTAAAQTLADPNFAAIVDAKATKLANFLGVPRKAKVAG